MHSLFIYIPSLWLKALINESMYIYLLFIPQNCTHLKWKSSLRDLMAQRLNSETPDTRSGRGASAVVLEGVGGMLAWECTCPTEREMLLRLTRVGSTSARSALRQRYSGPMIPLAAGPC